MNGKGDTPRPVSVPADEFAARWEATFGKKGKVENGGGLYTLAGERVMDGTPVNPVYGVGVVPVHRDPSGYWVAALDATPETP